LVHFDGDPKDQTFHVEAKNLDPIPAAGVEAEAGVARPEDRRGDRILAQEPRETWSATIVLADGRTVRVPDPAPDRWELVEERKVEKPQRTRVALASIIMGDIPSPEFFGGDVKHDEGRCWLADMFKIVNATHEVSPFEERFAYATELRRWRERPAERARYSGCDSILACLW
jgi:hypothetical protein